MLKVFLSVMCLVIALALVAPLAAQQAAPALIPWPKSIDLKPGMMELGPHSRVVAADPALLPLATILADELHALVELSLPTAEGKGAPGDVVLALDPALKGETQTIEVADRATICGGSYAAVALGTATLLQSTRTEGDKMVIPRMSVHDEPAVEYRGVLIDVARQYHSLKSLKQIVQLCRLYKIRYLQLHLTDDQSFMFPSKTYPKLAAQNWHRGQTYTIAELKDLVSYADARNVTIVPEYETPGHSAAANRAMPDLFMIRGTKPYEHHASINFAKDEVMKAVATIVGEMCDVFRSSPYFHIGGDEADLAFAHQNADFQAAMKKHKLPNQHQLYRKFVVDMNEIVKRHGKRMIVWEGFGREPNSPVQLPKDVLVMAYEIRFYMPDALVHDGYEVINASWTPLYVVNANCRPPEEIYAWQLRQFKPFGAKAGDQGVLVPPQDKVFGAQMCSWEQPEKIELPSLRNRVPAMAERIWNPAAGKSYQDFARRWAATDRLLERMAR